MTDDDGSVVASMRAAGHWNPMWYGVAELDPEWTEAFTRTTMRTYRGGVLTPAVVRRDQPSAVVPSAMSRPALATSRAM